MRDFITNLPLAFALALVAACGGASDTTTFSGGGTGSAGIQLESPASGALLNVSQPTFLVAFSGDVDMTSFALALDGQTLPPGSDWTILPTGASGSLSAIGDGTHQLLAQVFDFQGHLLETGAPFQVSTGGGGTTVRGLLRDPEGDLPIAGASVYLEEDSGRVAFTDSHGLYSLEGGLSGAGLHLVFDPRALEFSDQQGPYVYPLYKRPIDVISGATMVQATCFLPKVRAGVTFADLIAQGIFDCQSHTFLQPYVLSAPAYPELAGTELLFPAGTFVEFLPDAAPCEQQFLALAPVDKAKAPSNLPPEIDPAVLITIQPTGMHFLDAPGGQAQPLPITFPNRDALAVGNELTLFSVDHATGMFVEKGIMIVDSADPTRIVTLSGGVEGGSWHCPCAPGLPGCAAPDGGDGPCGGVARTNPFVDMQTGMIREVRQLAPWVLYDDPFQLELVYDSAAVVDEVAARVTTTIDVTSAVPERISISPNLDGIEAGPTSYFDTQSFPEEGTSELDLLQTFDVRGLGDSLMRYTLDVKSHFANSTATGGVTGNVAVRRLLDGPFGRGWSLAGDDRIIESQLGDVVVFEGDGGREFFEEESLQPHGLTMTLYADDSDSSMLAFFNGVEPQPFTVYTAGTAPETVTEIVIPNLEFPTDTNGAWILHAGVDGLAETTTATAPQGDDISLIAPGGSDTFGGLAEGYLDIPFAGDYTFQVLVDDAFALEIDGHVVSSLTGVNSSGNVTSGLVALPQGPVRFRAAFNDKLLHFHLRVFAQGPGFAGGEVIPASAFSVSEGGGDAGILVGSRGVFATLKRLEPTTHDGAAWERRFPNGTLERFDGDGRVLLRSDRRDRTVTYVRSATGRLEEIQDPTGGRTILNYQGGHIVSLTDPMGRTTAFTFDGPDLETIEEPGGSVWTYAYDGGGLLTSRTDPDGRTNHHEYDAHGRFLRTTYPDGTSREVQSKVSGLLQALPGTHAWGTAPVPPFVGEYIGAYTNETGTEATAELMDRGEAGVSLVQTEGLDGGRVRRTTQSFDPATLLELDTVVVEEDVAGSNAITKMHTSRLWDLDRGLPLEVTRHAQAGAGLADRTTRFGWDAVHAWLTSVTLGVGTEEEFAVTFTLDPHGNPMVMTPPSPAGATVLSYDEDHGWALKDETDSTGAITSLVHAGPLGNTSELREAGHTTTYARDAAGNLADRSLQDGSSTAWTRDAFGRALTVADGEGGTMTYRRSTAGQLDSVVDSKQPAGTHRFGYDARGRLTSWTDQLVWTQGRTLDDAGRVIEVVDRDGVVTRWTYNQRGLATSVQRWEGLSASAPATVTSIAYDSLDRVVSAHDEVSFIAYEYTDFGELAAEISTTVVGQSRIEHEYDAVGREIETRYQLPGMAAAKIVHREYDDAGRLTVVNDSETGSFAFAHDTAGRRTQLLRPGGVLTNSIYDSDGQLERVETRLANGSVSAADQIVRDAAGRIGGLTLDRSILFPSGVSTTFTFDRAGRLTTASSNEPSLAVSYGPYDAAGNRWSNFAHYDAADQLLDNGETRYVYDRAGRLVETRDLASGALARSFSYDLLGRLTRVEEPDGAGVMSTIHEASYDVLGRRVRVNDRTMAYSGDSVIAVYDSGALAQTWTPGPGIDEPLAFFEPASGITTFSIADALGSIVQHIRSGVVVAEASYDAFGVPVATTAAPFEVGYRGREYDAATGLYHNRARAYDPSTGRFLTREPLQPGMLQSAAARGSNGQSYAWNDPLSFADPSGLFPQRVGARWARSVGGSVVDVVASTVYSVATKGGVVSGIAGPAITRGVLDLLQINSTSPAGAVAQVVISGDLALVSIGVAAIAGAPISAAAGASLVIAALAGPPIIAGVQSFFGSSHGGPCKAGSGSAGEGPLVFDTGDDASGGGYTWSSFEPSPFDGLEEF